MIEIQSDYEYYNNDNNNILEIFIENSALTMSVIVIIAPREDESSPE